MSKQQVDANGNPAPFQPSDRVYVCPNKQIATVEAQDLCWDYPDSFWGNVVIIYGVNGQRGVVNNWQLLKVVGVCPECGVNVVETNSWGLGEAGISIPHNKECSSFKPI